MMSLPDDATVVRGGRNVALSFLRGSGVVLDADERLEGVSVNAGVGMSIEELCAPIPSTGYPGIPHNQLGVTTVGAIREAGGEVVPSPNRSNPHHATLTGLTAEVAAELFRPTVTNPYRMK